MHEFGLGEEVVKAVPEEMNRITLPPYNLRSERLDLIIRELARHGYSLSPGTLYPILNGLEQDGFLQSEKQVVGGKVRKYYLATKDGKPALKEDLVKVRELMNEVDDQSQG